MRPIANERVVKYIVRSGNALKGRTRTFSDKMAAFRYFKEEEKTKHVEIWKEVHVIARGKIL